MNNKSPLTVLPNWIPTAVLLPSDGESVLVRGRYDAAPRAVVFRCHPIARWESRETVYQFEYFNQWAFMLRGRGPEASPEVPPSNVRQLRR